MLYLGVDPGLTGAAVAVDEAGKLVRWIPASWDMRSLSDDVYRWLDDLGAVDGAGIEEPISYVKNNPGITKSAQAVAMSCGQWIGMLAAVGIRGVRKVRPQSWQAVILGKFPRGESKPASMRWARLSHGKPMDLAIRAHGDGVADACGIAEWVRLEVRRARLTGQPVGVR